MPPSPSPSPLTGSLSLAPSLSPPTAARLARDHFGIDGRATPLPSERDRNFLVEAGDGRRMVLKVANAAEERAMLEAQQAALRHLAGRVDVVPPVLPTVHGETLARAVGEDGREHILWAVGWLPGVPLACVGRRSPALLRDLGRRVGELSAALVGFDHPAIHRDFYWDLANGRRIVRELRPLVDDSLGAVVDAVVAEYDRHTAPLLPRLRRAAIHGDPNDHNVLVGGGTELEERGQRVVGIVDLGDMVHGWTVSDLAIAIAYAVLDAGDPLAAAAEIVRGAHAAFPLDEAELGALHGLVALRLCASVCIAAMQQRERPDDAYLTVSQQAIRRTLPRLAAVPFRFAAAVYRAACGLEPSAPSERVVAFLRRHAGGFAPVLGIDLRREPTLVLDLSVGSPLVAGDPRGNLEPALTPRIETAMREAGVRVAVGRWDEPRLLYQAPAFAGEGAPEDERRTIHLGLDLFADAGTTVHAPLAGTVHALADNDAPQDYGPVIVLRHTTDDGTEFFTLYGHLSRESLAWLEVGQPVAAGQRIASLGTAAVNGGWTPHLHLQIITDLLDLGVGFPGVGRPGERQVWRSLSPDPNLLVGIPAERFPRVAPPKTATLAARRTRLGGNLSIGYRDPLKIARGWMQWLYDGEGRRYLDAYNNVPHVGHCHPRVVHAGQAQMGVLNTNTRYLSDLLNEYAERLAATLPAPLRVCWFVNSASEANELALRLARACTGRRDTIVLEAAYHGNTTGLIDISPYKHAGPGGSGAPDWVHVAPLPDTYRGAFRRSDPDAGPRYARAVGDIVDRLAGAGRGLAAFIAETCPSVGGQLVFPPGYLREVYRRVRAAGGVCIADEVQTGLGRMGTSFWAFEDQGVVPDIVVAGKPLGNGHPIGAVVTTPEIAAAFDNGMEYFSTFGGNNVSCAIGLAVLDVLRDEGLQAHALRVGDRMLAGLRELGARHPLFGDVRGSGLFLGVELVRDRATLEPAGAEASWVANRMREHGILLGTDGPWHNVVKIRPPMPFDEADADRLVETLDRVLRELDEVRRLDVP